MIKYKENICDLASLKDFKQYQYSYGHTSTIYKIKDKVIKEVYLPSNDLTKTSKLAELEVTIFMEENFPEYSIPFYGYDVCSKRLYMEFEYVGKSLGESILDYSVKELKSIYNKVIETLDIINTKVYHNDLTLYNIYVRRNPYVRKSEDFDILLGDWGKGSIKSEEMSNDKNFLGKEINNDKNFFSKEFLRRLTSAYYFKDHSIQELKDLMVKEGIYKKFRKSFDREKKYIMNKFSFRPKYFFEAMIRYNYHLYLTRFIFDNYGEDFFIKHTKFTPSMLKFIKSI